MGPVIKVCELVTRRPDLDVEAFQRYWRDVHGPIVAAIPGLVRYVQSHPRLGGYRNGPLVYDGVAEIWVQDKAALATMATTAQFASAKADEPNFIDTTTLVELAGLSWLWRVGCCWCWSVGVFGWWGCST